MKTCRICLRALPEDSFASQGRRYKKPYCKPCYNAFQAAWRRTDYDERRPLTIAEFREEVLPLMIDAGEAPWVGQAHVELEHDPFYADELVTDEDRQRRHEEIMDELRATDPLRQSD